MSLTPPQPLGPAHDIAKFECGVASLDDWLKRRARPNQPSGASRTFVVCDNDEVIAYYAFAARGLSATSAPGRFRRNMPDPVPIAILGRLAVSRSYQGKGLGRGMVRDAVLRLLAAGDTLGIRGLLAHALSDDARRFYLALGFEPSPIEPMTLMITLADARANLNVSGREPD